MSGHWFKEKGVELEKEPPPLVDQILGWVGLERSTISIIVFIILLVLVLVFLD